VTFVAVKCDIVHSRRLKDRSNVRERLLRAVRDTNERFASAIVADFSVTHGDGCQGLLYEGAISRIIDIIEFIIDGMHPVQVRFGIGFGTLSTVPQEKVVGMDGSAWRNAEEALEAAKRERMPARFKGFGASSSSCGDSLACADPGFSMDEYLSSTVSLLLHIRMRWTLDLRRVTELLQEGKTQAEVASSRGVSAAAVSKRLTRAGWREYRGGAQAIRQLLARWVARPEGVGLGEAAIVAQP